MTRRRQPEIEPGVLLVDKPAGPSSHAVVDWIRWVFRGAAVGHCGTLDPAATGLLVVVLGAATRVAAHLSEADKAYRARIVVGCSTTTVDAEGETVERMACEPGDAARAVEVVRGLLGAHELAPPQFSAVKVGGVAAHVRARAAARGDGEPEALAPRPMTVHAVDGVCATFDPAEAIVCIDAVLDVSKGTYIRSLAEVVGRRLGRPAHLGSLRRLRSGSSTLDDPRAMGPLEATALPTDGGKPRWRIRPRAVTGVEADASREEQGAWLERHRVPLHEAWPLPWVELPAGDAAQPILDRLLNGQRLELAALGASAAGLGGRIGIGRSAPGGAFFVARVESGEVRPERMVVRPNASAAA